MQPAAERAYDFVKEKIIDGSFEPSQMLSEASLATEMGISRTPMHEAFLRLEVEGFLQLYRRKSARFMRHACSWIGTVLKRSAQCLMPSARTSLIS